MRSGLLTWAAGLFVLLFAFAVTNPAVAMSGVDTSDAHVGYETSSHNHSADLPEAGGSGCEPQDHSLVECLACCDLPNEVISVRNLRPPQEPALVITTVFSGANVAVQTVKQSGAPPKSRFAKMRTNLISALFGRLRL